MHNARANGQIDQDAFAGGSGIQRLRSAATFEPFVEQRSSSTDTTYCDQVIFTRSP